jgi:Caspase domain/PAN domain
LELIILIKAVRLLCLGLLFVLSFQVAVQAQNKMALVIGNSRYSQLPALANPANDAKLLGENLQALGFTVTSVTDQSQAQMKSAIAQFTQRVTVAGPDTIAMMYYAGHGVQIDGTNYLIPVDANVQTAGDVLLGAVSATDLLKTLELASAKVNVLVLDACRNNPFKSNTRSISRGLARVEAPPGSIVAYATAPGQVAADGESGNSPYAEALARNLVTPGLALEAVFRQVRIEVSQKTSNAQIPWEETSLTQEVVLQPAGIQAAIKPQPTPAQTTSTPELEAARAYMVAVGSNKIEDYMAFLQKHPVAKEAPLALRNIEMLADEKNWREAAAQNTLGAYKIYLNLHPQGTYIAEAQNQIARLTPVVAVQPQPLPKISPPIATPTVEQMYERLGYDVSGNDIQTLRGVGFSDCSDACANMAKCAAAAYRNDLQRCYLKSTATLVIKNEKVNMILRASLRKSVRTSEIEMLPQIDLPGGDMFPNSSKVDSAQKCLRLCEKTNGCNGFSYVTSNKACWLKASFVEATDSPAVVSGMKR